MLARQCLICGLRVGEWLPKTTLPEAGRVGFDDWDDEHEREGLALQSADWVERRRIQSDEWNRLSDEHKRRYWEYLKSPEWKSKRQRVVERDPKCRACERRPTAHVHHLTYVRIFNEPLFDLVGVCEMCHEALHPEKRNAVA